MAIEFFKNKPAVIFLAIGFACLSIGGYEAWNTKRKQLSTQQNKPENLEQYQSISKDIKNDSKIVETSASASDTKQKTIKVDISGAVKNPGVYDLIADARISEALDKAGGVETKKADISWIARNLNLATKLVDGDKIYIPTKNEVNKTTTIVSSQVQSPSIQAVGVTQGVLGYQQSTQTTPEPTNPSTTVSPNTQTLGKVSVNSASSKELDTLPGVGEVTAEKIIDNRPYTSLEELKTKKAVNNSVFEKIKDKISL